MASLVKHQKEKKLSGKKRQGGVLLEDIDAKLDAVLESQGAMTSIQDRMEQRQGKMEERQGRMEERQESMGERQSSMEQKLSEFRSETKENFKTLFRFRDETQENFKTIFQYLSRLDDELAEIKKEITNIRSMLSSKSDIVRVEALEGRVHQLEIELAQYKNKYK